MSETKSDFWPTNCTVKEQVFGIADRPEEFETVAVWSDLIPMETPKQRYDVRKDLLVSAGFDDIDIALAEIAIDECKGCPEVVNCRPAQFILALSQDVRSMRPNELPSLEEVI